MNKQEFITYFKKAPQSDKDSQLERLCKGKKVLDVGCIGQDRNYKDADWLHEKIRSFASEVDGVDILAEAVNELNKKGYSMFTPEELISSGKKDYDVVLMADVIEHVNDPVGFLVFYSSFLSKEGVIVVTTPNANRSTNFVGILISNSYSLNPEHTCWFCPRTFAEVAARAEIEIQSFFWLKHYKVKHVVPTVMMRVRYWIDVALSKFRSNFNPNMLFVLSGKKI